MYLVVFRNRKRADIDQAAYEAEAVVMEKMARAQPGFLSFKSYAALDGEFVAISEWESEGSARGWGAVAEHRAVQARARSAYYQDYTLFRCSDPRIKRFIRKEQA